MKEPPESIKDSYVYILFRPDGRPCYVGKGKGDRWEQHERKSHNAYLNRIIAKAGGSIPKVKIREGLSHEEALLDEIAFIAAIGRECNGGPLVNMTDGGDGVVGYKRTDEQRAKMSADRKGRPVHQAAREKISATLAGREKTPEHSAAVSAAKKGVLLGPMSQSQRDAIGAAHKGRKRSEAEIEACRRGQANMTEETRAQKSAKITAALTGKKLSPEHREKISQIQRGMVRSEEFKARVSASLKAMHAARRAKQNNPDSI